MSFVFLCSVFSCFVFINVSKYISADNKVCVLCTMYITAQSVYYAFNFQRIELSWCFMSVLCPELVSLLPLLLLYLCICICVFVFVYLYLCICILYLAIWSNCHTPTTTLTWGKGTHPNLIISQLKHLSACDTRIA